MPRAAPCRRLGARRRRRSGDRLLNKACRSPSTASWSAVPSPSPAPLGERRGSISTSRGFVDRGMLRRGRAGRRRSRRHVGARLQLHGQRGREDLRRRLRERASLDLTRRLEASGQLAPSPGNFLDTQNKVFRPHSRVCDRETVSRCVGPSRHMRSSIPARYARAQRFISRGRSARRARSHLVLLHDLCLPACAPSLRLLGSEHPEFKTCLQRRSHRSRICRRCRSRFTGIASAAPPRAARVARSPNIASLSAPRTRGVSRACDLQAKHCDDGAACGCEQERARGCSSNNRSI